MSVSNVLMFTSAGFIIPCCVFSQHLPSYLKALLFMNSSLSVLFWANPVQHSTIHKIDRLVARSTVISFMVYNILKNRKTLVIFFMCVTLVLFSLYLSNHFSIGINQWGSKEHVFAHGFAHVFGIIGIYATCLSSVESFSSTFSYDPFSYDPFSYDHLF